MSSVHSKTFTGRHFDVRVAPKVHVAVVAVVSLPSAETNSTTCGEYDPFPRSKI